MAKKKRWRWGESNKNSGKSVEKIGCYKCHVFPNDVKIGRHSVIKTVHVVIKWSCHPPTSHPPPRFGLSPECLKRLAPPLDLANSCFLYSLQEFEDSSHFIFHDVINVILCHACLTKTMFQRWTRKTKTEDSPWFPLWEISSSTCE